MKIKSFLKNGIFYHQFDLIDQIPFSKNVNLIQKIKFLNYWNLFSVCVCKKFAEDFFWYSINLVP